MNINDFNMSLQDDHPPTGMDPLLLALWYDTKDNWEKSHEIASEIDTKDGSLLHAYLHRKEGDIWNADYWYRRAGSKRPDHSLAEEMNDLVKKFTE